MVALPKSAAVRATIGLVLGLIVGLAIGSTAAPAFRSFATALEAIGVFALAVTLAVKLGSDIVGAVGFYIALHSGLLVIQGVLFYVVACTVGGMPFARFARAMLPAQVVAFSTRSSVAALPAVIDGAERGLGIPAKVAGFSIPLAVTLLRSNTGVSWIVCAVFIAKLYGVRLSVSQMALITAVSIAMSVSVPGIPGGGLLIVAPAFMMVFKTTINVTGTVTSTVVLARMEARSEAYSVVI